MLATSIYKKKIKLCESLPFRKSLERINLATKKTAYHSKNSFALLKSSRNPLLKKKIYGVGC